MKDRIADQAIITLIDSAHQICTLARKYRYRRTYGSFPRRPFAATYCILAAAVVLLHLDQNTGLRSQSHGDLDIYLFALEELSVS